MQSRQGLGRPFQRHRTVDNIRHFYDVSGAPAQKRNSHNSNWEDEFWNHSARRGSNSLASSPSTFEEVESLCFSKSSSDSMGSSQRQLEKFNSSGVWNGPSTSKKLISRQSSTTSTSTSRSSGLFGDAGRAEMSADINTENRQFITDTLLESMELLGSHGNLDFADRFYLETIFQRVLDWNNGLSSQSTDEALNVDKPNGAAKISQRSLVKHDGFRSVNSSRSHAALRERLEKIREIDKSQSGRHSKSETKTNQISYSEKRRRRDLILPEEDDVGTDSRRMYQPPKSRGRKDGINREISHSSRDTSTSSKGLSENSVNAVSRRSYLSSMSSLSMDNGSLRSSPQENTVPQPANSSNLATLLPHFSSIQAGSFESTASPSDPFLFSQPYTTSHAERVLMGLGFGAAEGFLPERFLKDWYTKISKAQLESKIASMTELKSQSSCDNPVTVPQQTMPRAVNPQKEITNYNRESVSQLVPSKYPSPRLHQTNNHLPTSNYQDSKLERLKEYISAYSNNMSIDDRQSKIKQFAMSRQKSLPLCLETLNKAAESGTKHLGIDPFDKEARLQMFISDVLSSSEGGSNSGISPRGKMHSGREIAMNSSKKYKDIDQQHHKQLHMKNFSSEENVERRTKEFKQGGNINYNLGSKNNEIITKHQLSKLEKKCSVSNNYQAALDSKTSRPMTKAPDINLFTKKTQRSPTRQRAVDSGDIISRNESKDTETQIRINISKTLDKTENFEKENFSSDICQRQLHTRDSTISKDSIEVADIMQNQSNKDRLFPVSNQRQGTNGKGPALKSALKHVEPAMVSIVLEDIDEDEGKCNADLLSVSQDGIHLVIPLSTLSPIPQSPITVIEVSLDNQQDSIDTEGTDSSKDTDDEHMLTPFYSDEYNSSKNRSGRRSSLCNLIPKPEHPQRRRSTGIISPIPCQLSLTQMPIVTKDGHSRRRISLEVPALSEINKMLEKNKRLHANQSNDNFDELKKDRDKRRASFSEAEPIIINDVLARARNVSPLLEKQFSSPHDRFEKIQNQDIPQIQCSIPLDTNEEFHSFGSKQYIQPSNHDNKHSAINEVQSATSNVELRSSNIENYKDAQNITVKKNASKISCKATNEFKIANNRSIESSPGSTKSAFKCTGKRTMETCPAFCSGYYSETDADEFPVDVIVNLKPRPISSIAKNLHDENIDVEGETSTSAIEMVSTILQPSSSSPTLQFSDSDHQFTIPGHSKHNKVKAQMISRAVEANDSSFPYLFLDSQKSNIKNSCTDYYYASDRSVQCDLIKSGHQSTSQHLRGELINKFTQTNICKYEISCQTTDTFYFVRNDCQIPNQANNTQAKAVNTVVCLIGREHGKEYTKHSTSANAQTDYNNIDETIQEIDDELSYIDNKKYQRTFRTRTLQSNLKPVDTERSRIMALDSILGELRFDKRDHVLNDNKNSGQKSLRHNEVGLTKRFAPSTWKDAIAWANSLDTDNTNRRTVGRLKQELQHHHQDITHTLNCPVCTLNSSVYCSISDFNEGDQHLPGNKEVFSQCHINSCCLREISKNVHKYKSDGNHDIYSLEHTRNNNKLFTTNTSYDPNNSYTNTSYDPNNSYKNTSSPDHTECQHLIYHRDKCVNCGDYPCTCSSERDFQDRKCTFDFSPEDYNKSLAKHLHQRLRSIQRNQATTPSDSKGHTFNKVDSMSSEELIVGKKENSQQFTLHPISHKLNDSDQSTSSLVGKEHTDRSHSKLSRLKYKQSSIQSSSNSLDIEIDFMTASKPLGMLNSFQSNNQQIAYTEDVNNSQTILPDKTCFAVNTSQLDIHGKPNIGVNPLQSDTHVLTYSREHAAKMVEMGHHINLAVTENTTGCSNNLSQSNNDISFNIDTSSSICPDLISDDKMTIEDCTAAVCNVISVDILVPDDYNKADITPVINANNSNSLENKESILLTTNGSSGISEVAIQENKSCLSSSSVDKLETMKMSVPDIILSPIKSFQANLLQLPGSPDHLFRKAQYPLRSDSHSKSSSTSPLSTPKSPISEQVMSMNDHDRSLLASKDNITHIYTFTFGKDELPPSTYVDTPIATTNKNDSNEYKVMSKDVKQNPFSLTSFGHQIPNQEFLDRFSDTSILPRLSSEVENGFSVDIVDENKNCGLSSSVTDLESRRLSVFDIISAYTTNNISDVQTLNNKLHPSHSLAESHVSRCNTESVDIDMDSNKSEADSNENLELDEMEYLVEASRKLRQDSDSSYSEAVLDISDSLSEDSFYDGSSNTNNTDKNLLALGNDADDLLQVSDFGGLSPTNSQTRIHADERSLFSIRHKIYGQLRNDEPVSRSTIRPHLRDLPAEPIPYDVDSDDELDPESELKLREQLRQSRRESRHSLKDNSFVGHNLLLEEKHPNVRNRETINNKINNTESIVSGCKSNILNSNKNLVSETSLDELDQEISKIALNGPIIRKLTKMSSDPVDKNLYCLSPSIDAKKENSVNLTQNSNPLEEETLTDIHCEYESDNTHLTSESNTLLHSNTVEMLMAIPKEKVETTLVETLSETDNSEIKKQQRKQDDNCISDVVIIGSNTSRNNVNEDLSVARVLDVEFVNEESEKETSDAGDKSFDESSADLIDELEMIALFNKIDHYDRTMNLFVDYSSDSSSEEFKLSQISEEETQCEDTSSEEGEEKQIWQVRNRFVVVKQDTQDTGVESTIGSKIHDENENSNHCSDAGLNNKDVSSLPTRNSEIILSKPCDDDEDRTEYDLFLETDPNDEENRTSHAIQSDVNEIVSENKYSSEGVEAMSAPEAFNPSTNRSLQIMFNNNSTCNNNENLSSQQSHNDGLNINEAEQFANQIRSLINFDSDDNLGSTRQTSPTFETQVLETTLDLAGNIITRIKSSRTLRIKYFNSGRINHNEVSIKDENPFGLKEEPKHTSSTAILVGDYRSKDGLGNINPSHSKTQQLEVNTSNIMLPDTEIMKNNNTHILKAENSGIGSASLSHNNSFEYKNKQAIDCGESKNTNNLLEPTSQFCAVKPQDGDSDRGHSDVTVDSEDISNMSPRRVSGRLAKMELHKMLGSMFLNENVNVSKDNIINYSDETTQITELGTKEDLKNAVRSMFFIDRVSASIDTPAFNDLHVRGSSCSNHEEIKDKICSTPFTDGENSEVAYGEFIQFSQQNMSSNATDNLKESLDSATTMDKGRESPRISASKANNINEASRLSSCLKAAQDQREHALSVLHIDTTDSENRAKRNSHTMDICTQPGCVRKRDIKQKVLSVFHADTNESGHLDKETLQFTDTPHHVCSVNREVLKQNVQSMCLIDTSAFENTMKDRSKTQDVHCLVSKLSPMEHLAPQIYVSNETSSSLSTCSEEDNAESADISLSTVQPLIVDGCSTDLNTADDISDNESTDESHSDSSKNSQTQCIGNAGVMDDIKPTVKTMQQITHNCDHNNLQSSFGQSSDTRLISRRIISPPAATDRVKVTTMFSESKESISTSFFSSVSQSYDDSEEMRDGSLDDAAKKYKNEGLHQIRTQLCNKGKKYISNTLEEKANKNVRVLWGRDSLLRLHEQVNVSSPAGSDSDSELVTALTNQGDYDMRKRDLALGRISSDNDEGELGLSKDVYNCIISNQDHAAGTVSYSPRFCQENMSGDSSGNLSLIAQENVAALSTDEVLAPTVINDQPRGDDTSIKFPENEPLSNGLLAASTAGDTLLLSDYHDNQLHGEDEIEYRSNQGNHKPIVHDLTTRSSSSTSLWQRRNRHSNFLSPDGSNPHVWQYNNDMHQHDPTIREEDVSHPELSYLDIISKFSKQQESVKFAPLKRHDVEFIISPPDTITNRKQPKNKSVKFNLSKNTD